ncbi:MAG: hypothetical protein R2865_07730 [Deinococcales bacterium]
MAQQLFVGWACNNQAKILTSKNTFVSKHNPAFTKGVLAPDDWARTLSFERTSLIMVTGINKMFMSFFDLEANLKFVTQPPLSTIPCVVYDKAVMKLRSFKVLTFDCYGTLIDWETGMVEALKPLTHRPQLAAYN